MSTPRILIVDDEPNLSDLLRICLTKDQRFEVRVENYSVRALASAIEFQPDAILLDVNMPGKDGEAVAHEIHAEPKLHGIPIVFLSSLISHESSEHEILSGGACYLSKPVSPTLLIGALERVLIDTTAVA